MKARMEFCRPGTSARVPATASPANNARKALLKRIQRQQLRKLQSMLPGSARSRLSAAKAEENPVAVINSVLNYIDSLHATILARVRQGTLSPDVAYQLGLLNRASPPSSPAPSPQPRPVLLKRLQ